MPDETVPAPRRRQYRNPPVVEAIARLEWVQPVAWNVTTPGLLYQSLRESYPEEPGASNLVQAEVTPGEGAEGATNLELRTGPQKMVFSRDEKSRLFIVGPIDASVHGLHPYEGWEDLEQRLFDGYDRIDRVFGGTGPITKLGLRYVNRVEILATGIRFEDYLTVGFSLPPTFPQDMRAFLDRVEVVYPDDPFSMAFTWGSTQSAPGSSAFILDFDFTAAPSAPIDLAEARRMLSMLKVKATGAFEGLLLDSLREVFGEIH